MAEHFRPITCSGMQELKRLGKKLGAQLIDH